MPGNRRRGDRRGAFVFLAVFLLVLPVLFFSYYVFGEESKVSTTLVHASVVFRHGDRNPLEFYPNDPYKDPKFWPEGLGALTNKGKQQMYKLGQTFRQRYTGFLNELYSPEDVYMMSSDNDRCLMSAQLFLAGLYPPVGRQIWSKHIHWQPVPVHTVPRHLDQLIVVKKPCPKYEREFNQTLKSDYIAKVNEENAELFNYLTEHSGMKVKDLTNLEVLYNTLDNEATHNLKLPDWAEKVYDEKMKNLAALLLSTYTYTPTMKKLKGGPILKQIVENMSLKVLGTLKPNRALHLYSAHDLTLVSVFRALGFHELLKPDYGAAMLFELHQPFDSGDHIVELLYLNNTEVSEPMKLKIPGCDEKCKLKDFLKITKDLIPENWDSECRLD